MNLLQMSISGAVMILTVIVIRALAINRLPKKTFLALWGIVLLRLLVPVSFPSPFSAYSFINRHLSVDQSNTGIRITNTLSISPTTLSVVGDITPHQTVSSISPYVVVWVIGFVLCTLYFTVSYFKCRREFGEALPIKNEFLANWIVEHHTTRPIAVRQSSRISAPLTYGILNPIILMPKNTNWGNTKQMKYILAHEFVHIRRFDSAIKLLLTASLCIHWFNPLVWVMYILSNRDIELSCDETVVRSYGETTKSAYALTLISMEEKKSGLAPLCNNFSKNAIEERITAIMKMKKTSIIAAFVAIVLIVGVTTALATSAVPTNKTLTAIPNTEFTLDEYAQLLALRFDSYQNMTVADYQEKVWTIRDTTEYMVLLERFSQDNQLYDMRYTNETASFLFNTLEPLTAEKWKTQDFGSYVQAPEGDVQGDPAMLEYLITLTILDTNGLTVGEYERARQGIMEGLQKFLQGKSNVELQNEKGMDSAIRTEIDRLKNQWNTNALQFDITYWFTPLMLYDDMNTTSINDYNSEKREAEPGTEADYQSLLNLKTPDYQHQSVSTFNAALLEWANEDYDRNDRINVDVAWNDFHVSLTDEERSFITLTVRASGEENSTWVQSNYTGRTKENPILGNYNLSKELYDNERTAWANLYYQLTYHISDENSVSIGERDRILSDVLSGIQNHWDKTDIDKLLSMNSKELEEQLNTIISKYSNDFVQVSFTENNLQLESQSEPKIRD